MKSFNKFMAVTAIFTMAACGTAIANNQDNDIKSKTINIDSQEQKASITEVNLATFDQEVMEAEGAVLAEFYINNYKTSATIKQELEKMY